MCDNFYVNRTGIMRVCHESDGKEHSILFGTEGDIYTSLHSWVAGERSPFSLIAVEEAEVYSISYATMRRVLADFPEAVNWFLQLSLQQLYGLERRYLSFCSNNTEERLRTFMYNVDPKFKRMPGRKMVQHVPLKYIASYLGVAQATLSRLRAKIVRGDRRKHDPSPRRVSSHIYSANAFASVIIPAGGVRATTLRRFSCLLP